MRTVRDTAGLGWARVVRDTAGLRLALVVRAAGGLRGRLWVDAVLAAVIAAVNAPVALRGASVAAVVCYLVVHVPLVWRRAAPVAVCWTVFALAVLSALAVGVRVEGLYPEMVVAVAVYTVARYATRRHLVAVVATVELPAVVAFVINGPQWTTFGFVTAVLAATALAGTVVRIRSAYLLELVERARRLERERDQRAELAAAAERARIARDMHDIVAHNLTVMVALADGAALTAGAHPDRAAAAMAQVSATGRQALSEMRRALGVLRDPPATGNPESAPPAPAREPRPGGAPVREPEMRSGGGPVPERGARAGGWWVPEPGARAGGWPGSEPGARPEAGRGPVRGPNPGLGDLDALLAGVRAAGVEVRLTVDGGPQEWPAGAELAVYRIVQEALTNTMKHAGSGASAHVRLRYGPGEAEIEILDVGRPVGPAAASADGRGIVGMTERAAAYGGTLEAGPRADGPGWRVWARLRPVAAGGGAT
ncbi:histidine kinase [Dactylosporangium sp. NPDC005572]|uniref:sensor histidine kinase n=1 Tax=Dactylosporangium sp. NPDC005572 TaxID=3156889 RepID=UPI0033A1FCFE